MSVRDVVVVGGGPAGATAALLLARAGFDVELLERREFPRAKPCGDCISPGANAVLRRIGVWDRIISAHAAQLTGWKLSCSSDVTFTSMFAPIGRPADADVSIALPRAKLDAILLDAARAAGVHVRTSATVSELVRGHNNEIRGVRARCGSHTTEVGARATIGADGLRSRVARLLKAYKRAPRVRKVSFTAHVRGVPDVGRLGEMHVRANACLGIAPVENGSDPLCNVTLVLGADTSVKSPFNSVESVAVKTMLAGLRHFPERDLTHLINAGEEILASGPFDWPTRRIVFDGGALVGDAAGYYDPFTGQGIYQALVGAELLANQLSSALSGDAVTARALAPYESAYRSLTTPARRVQHAIDYVCARPRLSHRLFSGLAAAPSCASRLVAVTGDMARPRVLLSPFFLAKLAAASTPSLVS